MHFYKKCALNYATNWNSTIFFQKGHGYHLDLFVLAFLIAICSVMGLPWFVAATVRSITHVRSLIRNSELRAPGERPQFLGVRSVRGVLHSAVFHENSISASCKIIRKNNVCTYRYQPL